MSNQLRFAAATLVFSLTCSTVAATDLLVKHTLAQTATTSNEKAQADKLFQEGVQQLHRGEYPQALATYQQVLEIRLRLNDKAGIAQALNNMGEVYNNLFESQKEALDVLQPALAIRRELKDRRGEGETLDNIGSAYSNLNQNDKAFSTLQQALAIRREVKDRVGEGVTLSKIGITYSYLEQHPKALEFLQQARAIHQEVGDKYHLGITIFRFGVAYNNINDYKNALLWFNQALAFNREIGNRAVESRSLMLIGSVYTFQQQYDRSLEYFKQALAVAQAIPNKYAVLLGFQQLSNLYQIKSIDSYRRGLTAQAKIEAKNAIEIAQSALNIARELKKPKSEAQSLIALGTNYTVLGENQKAVELLEQALEIARKIKDIDIEDSVLSQLNLIYVTKGENILQIIQIQKRKLEIAREQKKPSPSDEVQLLINLGYYYNSASKYQLAISTFQEALAVAQKIETSKLSPINQELAKDAQLIALDGLSSSYRDLGEIDKALDLAQQGVKKAQSFNNPKLEAEALLHVSFIYSNAFHDHQKSIDAAQQALSIARKIKEQKIEANALKQLGDNYQKQGNYAKALEASEQLLSIAKQLDNSQFEFDALLILRDVYQAQGNLQKALITAQQIVTITQQKNLGLYQGVALINLSNSYLSVGDTAKAMEFAQQALTIAKKENNPGMEASALINIGNAYKLRGEYQQGIAASQQSLDISSKNKYLLGEVGAAYNLAVIYEALGEYQKLIAVTEPYLPRLKQLNNRSTEAQLLSVVGGAYNRIGANQKGTALVEQSLAIARELKNPALESTALHNLGSIYNSRSEYQKALELTQQSLKIAQDLQSPPLKIAPLSTLASIYNNLGDYNKSREYYQQVLANAKTLQNRRDEGAVLLNIASIYFAQDQPQKTVELSQQALTIFREIKEPLLEAFAHRMLSVGYGELNNDASAMQEAQTYLAFARQTKNSVWEKQALSLIGSLHRKFRRPSQAITAYQQALAISDNNQVTGADSAIYAGLAQIYRDSKPATAISYYKQSINQIQAVRRSIQGLPPELQQSFLNTSFDFDKIKRADIYRQLIDLLASQGRNAEATQVSDLLKKQEIRDISFSNEDTSRAPSIPLNLKEQQIQQKNDIRVALGQKIYRCEQGMDTCSGSQLKEMQDESDKLRKEFDQETQELEKLAPKQKEDFARGYQTIVEAQPGTILIQPIVLENKIWILWASAGGILGSKQVTNVGQNELWKTVKEYRDLLSSPGDITKLQATSKQLYQWLIAPIEGEVLKDKGIKHLVFSLDGATRYIPMGALFDGQKYLIEKYTISTVPTVSLTNSSDRLPKEVQKTPVLALGVSQGFPQFPALPNVLRELNAIKSIYPAEEIVNGKFNSTALRDNLKGQKIIHIATHGQFLSNDPKGSYLLLGTGERWAISEIEYLRNLSNVHLIVLSACETALGEATQDGKEILSISNYFIGGENKAKAVMASLWSVDDLSTTKLMQQFYQNLASGKMTKSEALQQAQLSLLLANNSNKKDVDRGLKIEIIPGASSKQPRASGYSHPYYWAPFILIGNGL